MFIKKLGAAALVLFAAVSAFASVDVNKADQAQLESVKGVGTSMSAKILDARKQSAFKDWPDLISRVHGIGNRSAAKLSAQGLTVNNVAYTPDATKSVTAKKTAQK